MTDSSCSCYDLATPLTATVTKTPMWASYPMQYLQSFNYKPYEVIVRPSDNQCLAGDYEPSPTCGWYYVKGLKAADSQGFTCQCSTSQIWDTTFGGSNQRTRANLNCDFWDNALGILLGDPPCSAHCLQFDSLWYSGYQLGTSSLQFTISVSLTLPNPSNSTALINKTLTLSPSVPLATTADQLVQVKLLGDLATYTSLPAVSNMILMVPQASGASPDQILQTNRSRWLLLDTSAVSLDGGECNKVGTSFSAFRYQADGCARAPQVCLSNQIKDLLAADDARVAAGKVPLYSLSRYTYGAESTFKTFSAGTLSFALPVTSTSTSLLLLTASADSVRFVTNVSPGSIDGMKLCTFNEVTCGGFEAGASRGYLSLNITNTGTLPAEFTLTVDNCSSNVLPIEARKVAMAAGVTVRLSPPIDVYVGDSAEDADRWCWVTLYNSQALVSDRKQLTFFTNATVLDDTPTGGYNGTGDGVGEAQSAVDCKQVCSSMMNVLCYVRNGCWRSLGGFLGVMAGVAAGIALLAVAAKAGLLTSALSSLMGLCSRGDGTAGSSTFGGGGWGGGGGGGGSADKATPGGRMQGPGPGRGSGKAAFTPLELALLSSQPGVWGPPSYGVVLPPHMAHPFSPVRTVAPGHPAPAQYPWPAPAHRLPTPVSPRASHQLPAPALMSPRAYMTSPRGSLASNPLFMPPPQPHRPGAAVSPRAGAL